MNIEELLNKYFEGETTNEEEKELRRFFTQGMVPKHLEIYRPMFAFFEAEVQSVLPETKPTIAKRKVPFRKHLLYTLSGIAAGIVLIIGIVGIHKHLNAMPESYVIIDGKCYTDENVVREQAMAAFRNVSYTQDEILDNLFND